MKLVTVKLTSCKASVYICVSCYENFLFLSRRKPDFLVMSKLCVASCSVNDLTALYQLRELHSLDSDGGICMSDDVRICAQIVRIQDERRSVTALDSIRDSDHVPLQYKACLVTDVNWYKCLIFFKLLPFEFGVTDRSWSNWYHKIQQCCNQNSH